MEKQASPDAEIIMYVVLRTDLPMSSGKSGAQIGHAVHLAYREAVGSAAHAAWARRWDVNDYPKIVLRAGSERELSSLRERLANSGIGSVLVVDKGRTEIPPGTVTALGVCPSPRYIVSPHLRRFQTLKERPPALPCPVVPADLRTAGSRPSSPAPAAIERLCDRLNKSGVQLVIMKGRVGLGLFGELPPGVTLPNSAGDAMEAATGDAAFFDSDVGRWVAVGGGPRRY